MNPVGDWKKMTQWIEGLALGEKRGPTVIDLGVDQVTMVEVGGPAMALDVDRGLGDHHIAPDIIHPPADLGVDPPWTRAHLVTGLTS